MNAVEAGLRSRWADHFRLPFDQQQAIDAARLIPVREVLDLLNRAQAEDWFGNGQGIRAA